MACPTSTTTPRRSPAPTMRRRPPIVFVLDGEGTLRYRGAPDADHDDPSQEASWLRSALDALLEGKDPNPAATTPVGCSIKWRE